MLNGHSATDEFAVADEGAVEMGSAIDEGGASQGVVFEVEFFTNFELHEGVFVEGLCDVEEGKDVSGFANFVDTTEWVEFAGAAGRHCW